MGKADKMFKEIHYELMENEGPEYELNYLNVERVDTEVFITIDTEDRTVEKGEDVYIPEREYPFTKKRN